ncbi:MAG: recombination protein O N-terminal domain-containing protein [Lentisphaeria bacterium]|nr:recombination protein O N-terminal domain-containing protein [Lentisphaeria bacterium]
MRTQYIVLAKRPYRESALLLSGVSPDAGKLDLVAHGAQKTDGTGNAGIDLYRELEVEYDDRGNSELHSLREHVVLHDFSALAEEPRHFLFAGRMGGFLLRNSRPDLPLPLVYDTLLHILDHLGRKDGWDMIRCSVVFKSSFLYENGLLPESVGEQQTAFLEQLIDAGVNGADLPSCRPEYWSRLNEWLNQLMDYHQLDRGGNAKN